MINQRLSLCSEFVFKFIDLFINLVFFFFLLHFLGGDVEHVGVAVLWMVVELPSCMHVHNVGAFYEKDSSPFGWWDQHHLSDAHSHLCKGLELHGGICPHVCVQVNIVPTWTAGAPLCTRLYEWLPNHVSSWNISGLFKSEGIGAIPVWRLSLISMVCSWHWNSWKTCESLVLLFTASFWSWVS